MIKHFHAFAKWVNSFRSNGLIVEFRKLTRQMARRSSKVLEVGCNLRPINKQSASYELHGLDPDPTIDVQKTRDIFNDFFNTTIEEMPVVEDKYDLIVLEKVFEHLEDNQIVLNKLSTLLSNNGKILIHTPSRFHPFALINQLIPESLKLVLLKKLMRKGWKRAGHNIGWPAYYSYCDVWSINRLVKRHGFLLKSKQCNYNAAEYFAFFPPLFLLVVLYEEIVKALNIQILCSDFIVVLEKGKLR